MPGFNRTGPLGEGPMTGGAKGLCNTAAGYFGNLPYGAGFGLRSGRGRRQRIGGRNMLRFRQEPERERFGVENETVYLKERAEILKEELTAINKRIEALEPKENTEI